MATSPYVPGSAQWYRWVEQQAQQHHVDIQRLWNRVDQTPQQWMGIWQNQEIPPIDPTSTTQAPCDCTDKCLTVELRALAFAAMGACATVSAGYTVPDYDLVLNLGGPIGEPGVPGNRCGRQVGGVYMPVEDGQVQTRVEVNIGFDTHVHKWKMSIRIYAPAPPAVGAPEGSFYTSCFDDAVYQSDTCTGTYTLLVDYNWHSDTMTINYPATMNVTGSASVCPTTTGPSTTPSLTTTLAPCGGECEWTCMEIWSGPWWIVTDGGCTPVDEFGLNLIPGCTCGSGPFTGGPCSPGELGDTRTEPCGVDGTTAPDTSTTLTTTGDPTSTTDGSTTTTNPGTTNGTTNGTTTPPTSTTTQTTTTTLPPCPGPTLGSGCAWQWINPGGTLPAGEGVWWGPIDFGGGAGCSGGYEHCVCGPPLTDGLYYGEIRGGVCSDPP